MPPQIPQIGGNADQAGGTPNIANTPGGKEQQSQWARSVARSGQIRNATGAVIRTRAQFKAYLNQNRLDLFTSAVEFQKTGDFILSSYVVYLDHNGVMEPLSEFLNRYPSLQQSAVEIRERLRPVQNGMNVQTPRLSQQSSEDFSNIF